MNDNRYKPAQQLCLVQIELLVNDLHTWLYNASNAGEAAGDPEQQLKEAAAQMRDLHTQIGYQVYSLINTFKNL